VIVALFNPRQDRWSDHFRLSGERIEPRTATGRATARLHRFNHADRLEERRLFTEAGLSLVPLS
jgi:hypothetical protein